MVGLNFASGGQKTVRRWVKTVRDRAGTVRKYVARHSTTPSAPTTPAFGHYSSGRRGVADATPRQAVGEIGRPAAAIRFGV